MIVRKFFKEKYKPMLLEEDFDKELGRVNEKLLERLNTWVDENKIRIISVQEESHIGDYVEQLPFWKSLTVYGDI